MYELALAASIDALPDSAYHLAEMKESPNVTTVSRAS
jgi:hypothetical protein